VAPLKLVSVITYSSSDSGILTYSAAKLFPPPWSVIESICAASRATVASLQPFHLTPDTEYEWYISAKAVEERTYSLYATSWLLYRIRTGNAMCAGDALMVLIYRCGFL